MTNYLNYKKQLAVLDADDTEVESWITVKGNHIPIKKGQSKEEAVKSFLESKGSNSSSKATEQKTESSKSGNQNSLKEKMQKLIKDNGKVYGWETEGLEKFAENVEGKSTEELKDLHEAYKERVAKLGMWVDTPTKLKEQFLGEVIEEQSNQAEKTAESKTQSKEDESWGGSHPKFDKLTDQYMPKTGEADNELGEVLRSINRVVYRYYNDGDIWNRGYGKETVNGAIKHLTELAKNKNTPQRIARGLENGLYEIKKNGIKNKDKYEIGLKILLQTIEFAGESEIEGLSKMKRNKTKATDSWKRLWGKK